MSDDEDDARWDQAESAGFIVAGNNISGDYQGASWWALIGADDMVIEGNTISGGEA